MGGQPGKPKPPGNPPVRPEPEEPKPIEEPPTPIGSSSGETPCPGQSRSDILQGEMNGPARVSNPPGETTLGTARSASMHPSIFVLLRYFCRRSLNCDAVLVIKADVDLAHLVSVDNGTNGRGYEQRSLEVSADLKRKNITAPL